jgi:hypothetical protein
MTLKLSVSVIALVKSIPVWDESNSLMRGDSEHEINRAVQRRMNIALLRIKIDCIFLKPD